MKKTLFALLLISTGAFAQSTSRPQCGTMQYLSVMKKLNPQLEAEMQRYNAQLEKWILTNSNIERASNAVITIPIVFHILYNKAEENISDAEIQSQLTAMNADFMGTNADASKIPSVFKGLADSPKIQFCLAQRTPDDKPTTGIVRIKTTKTEWVVPDDENDPAFNDMKFKAKGGDDAWDTRRYYNIWVCNLAGGLLGYAEFPTLNITNTYGYVGDYAYTGTINSKAPFNLGRTATHEIGHCLNLIHIWGDEYCGDDEVSDTPTQEMDNEGCPTFPHITCNNGPNGDMFMNYMDYSHDVCMNMFTKEQTTRMLAVINNPPWNVLKTSNACTPVGPNTIDESLINMASFDVFPNPSNGMVNFSFTVSKSSHIVEIKNLLGQVIFKDEIIDYSGTYTKSLNLQQYGKGTYLITITSKNSILAKKIIVY